MASYNSITLLGNLGKEPDFMFTSSGKAICKCSLAVNEFSGEKKKTTWFQLVFWEKLAETVEKYLEKGSQILVSGRMCCDEYTDKEGNKRYSWYVTATSLQMLGEAKQKATTRAATDEDFLDKIGF